MSNETITSNLPVKSSKLTFETNLYNKKEVFKLLKIAELAQLPILFVGPPGVGKTAAVLDYAKSFSKDENGNVDKSLLRKNVFILETDEGTKSSEVKGRIDIKHLVEANSYKTLTPIVKAKCVIINEVDKASSNLRNSLLGVMNEKVVFNGADALECNWKSFVATCNVIPKEEENNPFWDRFIIKIHITRLTANSLKEYFKKGGKNYRETITLNDPTQAELDAVLVPDNYIEEFINIAYVKLSDRTLSYITNLTKATALVYNSNVEQAIVKVMSILLNKNAAQELSKKLMSPVMRDLITKAELLKKMQNSSDFNKQLDNIEKSLESNLALNRLTETEGSHVFELIQEILMDHPLMINEENLDQNEFVTAMLEDDNI